MLDRKVQVVVAAVVDAAGAVGRAEEDRAAEVPVEEVRAEAAAVSEIVVPLLEAGAGVVVAEEAADVAEVEAEGVEASRSVRTLCLSVSTLAYHQKKSSCEHHWVDLLCRLAIYSPA